MPTIDIVDPPDEGEALSRAVRHLETYEWVVFTSANAVSRFCSQLPEPRPAPSLRIAAIGTATVAELQRHGLTVDLVPERFIAESLLGAFPRPAADRPGRVLLPSAEVTREVLAVGLRELGWEVDVVVAYRTVAAAISAAERESIAGADAVMFTSGSTIDQWVAVLGVEQVPPVVACIGPVTADAAARQGLQVDIVADVHTVDGLVDALIAHVTESSDA